MRRFVPFVLAGALALSAAAPAAATKPIGGCPNDQFVLMNMETFRQLSLDVGVPPELLFTDEWEAGWDTFDKNGDGNLCVKDLPDTPGHLDTWVFNVIDNTSNR